MGAGAAAPAFAGITQAKGLNQAVARGITSDDITSWYVPMNAGVTVANPIAQTMTYSSSNLGLSNG